MNHLHGKLSRALEQFPIQGDLLSEQVNINAWPSVVSSFELLEQVFKALVQVHDSNYTKQQMKSDGHNLEKIFCRLSELPAGFEDARRIGEGFAAWRSLHKSFPFCTLETFVHGIKSDYSRWRYFPLEGWAHGTPAMNSPHAMLEVALHAIHIIRGSVGQTDHGLKTVGNRMSFTMMNSLKDHLIDASLQFEGEDFSNFANTWLKESGGVINGVSKAMRAIKRGNVDDQNGHVHPQFRCVIESLVEELFDQKIVYHWVGNHNLRAFCTRAVDDDTTLLWDGSRFFNE